MNNKGHGVVEIILILLTLILLTLIWKTQIIHGLYWIFHVIHKQAAVMHR
jgi:hypothetical protein